MWPIGWRAQSGRYAAAVMPQTIGQPLRPQGGPAPPHGQGPLQRRRQPAGSGVRRRAALAARARPHQIDRHHSGAGHAGRAGGADRRGRRGRRAQDDAAHADPDQAAGRHPAEEPRRLGARLRAAGAAADRPGPLRRRAGGRWWWPRRVAAPRMPPSRSRSTTRCCRRSRQRRGGRGRARRGSTTTPPTSASTPTSATSSDRGGVRACRSCREARHLGAARHRRADGGARRGRRLRPGEPTSYTLHAGSGGVVRQKPELADDPRRAGRAEVRVECGDIGGNFGTRNAFFPEFALVAWAAKRLGRPVKWTCERSEAFASDYQGRDQAITLGAGAGRRRQFPRDARLDHLQHRRAQRDVRAAGEMRAS